MKQLKALLFVISLIIAPYALQASEAVPHEIIETAVNELLSEFEIRRNELAQDEAKLFQLVESVVVPRLDVPIIARLVLAKHWRTATDKQRRAFTHQLKTLLIRTYAKALFKYTGNEQMLVTPSSVKPEDKKTRVRTEVILPGTSAIEVTYALLKNAEEQWKIYDMTIDGISLVKNYRVSYGDAVAQKGLDMLIVEMTAKNSQPEPKE